MGLPGYAHNGVMAYHRAYGKEHQRIRAAKMAALRRHPGSVSCPRCGIPLHADMAIDLGHLSQADKAAGLPGRVLICSPCNRGEHSVPPHIRRQRQGLAVVADVQPRCTHDGELHPGPAPGSCLCDRPLQHHQEIARRERAEPDWSGPSHPGAPCPGCHGYTWSRLW
jgi:hypothetical protein